MPLFAAQLPTGDAELAAKRKPEVRIGIDFAALDNLLMPDNSTKNLIRNPSFETGFKEFYPKRAAGLDDTPNFSKRWSPDNEDFQIDRKVFHSGKASLLMRVWPKEASPWMSQCILADKGEYVLSFYAKSSAAKGNRMVVFFSEHTAQGRKWIADGTPFKYVNVDDSWQRYEIPMTLKRRGMYRLTFCGDTANDGENRINVDDIQFEKSAKATAFVKPAVESKLLSAAKDNFISDAVKPELKLELYGNPGVSGSVKVEITNFYREKIYAAAHKFTIGKNGTAVIPLNLKNAGRGVFVVHSEYSLAGGKKCRTLDRFAIVKYLPEKFKHRQIFSLQYGTLDTVPGFIRILERFQKLGVGAKSHLKTGAKISLDTYRKYGVEPMCGTMLSYFNKDDKMVGFGISKNVLRTIAYWRNGRYWNPNAGTPPPPFYIRDFKQEKTAIDEAYLKRFEDAVAAKAAENPEMKLWGLTGEITCKLPYSWWSEDGSRKNYITAYAKMLGAFVRGVRRGNPQAKVFQDDPANMAPESGILETAELLAECNKLGIKFDVIAIHPYRNTPEDPDLDGDTAVMLDMMAKQGYGKTDLIWPEMMHWPVYGIPQLNITRDCRDKTGYYDGNLSYAMGYQEKIATAYYARSYLVALKYSDRVKLATAGMVAASHIDNDLTPYACQLVPNTLGHLLGNSKFRADVRVAANTRCYIFEDEKQRPVAAIWNFDPETEKGLRPSPVAEVDLGNFCSEAFDLMYTPRTLKKGVNRFAVTPYPVFLRGKPGSFENLKNALNDMRFVMGGKNFMPVNLHIAPETTSRAAVTFNNMLSKKVAGTFDGKAFSVPASGKTTVKKIMLPALRFDRIRQVNAGSELVIGDSMMPEPAKLTGFAIHRAPAGCTLKNIDWKKYPAIELFKKGKSSADRGTLRMAWNTGGIFIELDIDDDKFIHREFPRARARWDNDSVQFFFDFFGDAAYQFAAVNKRGMGNDDCIYAVYPDKHGRKADFFLVSGVDSQLGLGQAAPHNETFLKDVPVTFTRRKNGYIYRMMIPQKYLLPLNLEKGSSFGMGLLAPDCDDDSLPRNRRCKSQFSLLSGGRGCNDVAHLYPRVLLAE